MMALVVIAAFQAASAAVEKVAAKVVAKARERKVLLMHGVA